MRSWKSTLLLGCLAALVATQAFAATRTRGPAAPAAPGGVVRCFGLDQSPLGSCVLTASPDLSSVLLSGIGASGNDGVTVPLSNLYGMSMQIGEDCDDTDSGFSCAVSYVWTVQSRPPSSAATMSLTVQTGHDDVSCDFPGTITPVERVELLLDGSVVDDEGVAPGAVVSMQRSSAGPTGTASDAIPSLDVVVDQHVTGVAIHDPVLGDGSLGQFRCSGEVVMPSSRVVVFGGRSFTCDAIVFSTLVSGPGVGDHAEMRCVCPVGCPLSSVSLSDESCGNGIVWMQGSGASHLTCSATSCSIDNLGSSGQDGITFVSRGGHAGGGGGGAGGGIAIGDPGVNGLEMELSPPSLTLDPVADDGASLECRLLGSSSCSSGPALATLRATMQGGQMQLESSFADACASAESVIVSLAGVVSPPRAIDVDGDGFARCVLAIQKGTPPAMMMSKLGSRAGYDVKANKKVAPQAGSGPAGRPRTLPTASSSTTSDQLSLHMSFRSPRVLLVGGVPLTGDDFTFISGGSSGTSGFPITISGQSFRMHHASTLLPSSVTSMEFSSMQSSGTPTVTPDVPGTYVLSTTSTDLQIPVRVENAGPDVVRAFSVTLHLSSNLVLSSPVVEGTYLSKGSPTQMFVVDNGGGSYTVDVAILGSSCSASGDGLLFTLPISAAQPASNGVGTVHIDEVLFRDCSNAPITMNPGGDGVIPIQVTAPPPVSGLTATQVKTGNDLDGTTRIALSWSPVSSTEAVDVYRAGFGNYPRYDDPPNAGSVPVAPTTVPPPAPWTLASLSSVSSSGAIDEPPTRDFYYFVIQARDAYGNPSSFSSRTSGTLDYHLGDVTNGVAACSGDNHVDLADVSFLGSHYGEAVTAGSSFTCLDVGPTTDFSVDARPRTDDKISFEDLVMFSINYSVVSRPQMAQHPAATVAMNGLRLDAPMLPAVGQTFDVALHYDGAGDAQALSAQLSYDHSVVEPVGVTAGELLDAQDRGGVVFSSEPGDVDAALLGVGTGLAGSGTLAHATFRVKAAGDPQLAIASVTARDATNRPVPVTLSAQGGMLPSRTTLGLAFPNPFHQQTTVRMSMHSAGPAALGVYDVAGRRVRTLLRGEQPAGTIAVGWDGRDDDGVQMAAGVYLMRLEAAGVRETRLVRLVR